MEQQIYLESVIILCLLELAQATMVMEYKLVLNKLILFKLPILVFTITDIQF